MKVAVVEGERKIAVREVPEPVPERDEVVIQVQYCGICGSDLEIYSSGANIRPGHEYAGDIVEVGSEVQGWKAGERVVVQPRRPCGRCYWCGNGYEIGLCEQFYVELLRYGGAFATYAKAKHDQLYRIPGDLSYEHATIAQPMSTPLCALRASGMQLGDTVMVLGQGPIGLLQAHVARLAGARAVYATELSRKRIELARSMGVEVIDINKTDPVDRITELTGGRRADVVFECSGSPAASLQSLALVRNGGTVVFVGICMDWAELPISKIALNGLTLKGLVAYHESDFATALNLIIEKKLDVAPLITSTMTLEDISRAFEKASKGEEGKVLIKP